MKDKTIVQKYIRIKKNKAGSVLYAQFNIAKPGSKNKKSSVKW
jgi:hypothetical protein